MAFDYRSEYDRYRRYYVNLRRFYEHPVIKVSVFVLVSFLTVLFFSIFAIRPTVTTVSELVRGIEDKHRIDQALGEKLVALDDLQTNIVSVQDELPLVLETIPPHSALGRLLQELEYVAQQEGVTIVSIQFQPVPLQEAAPAKAAMQTIKFSIVAGGEFVKLNQLLNRLKLLGRLVVLDDVEFISSTPNLKAQGLGTLVTIKGQTFFLPEGGTTNGEI